MKHALKRFWLRLERDAHHLAELAERPETHPAELADELEAWITDCETLLEASAYELHESIEQPGRSRAHSGRFSA
jgi:hypothetical protein